MTRAFVLFRAFWAIGLVTASCATAGGSTGGSEVETVAFELPDVQGEKVRPADYLGQVVLVDFWATWCKPCSVSFEAYESLVQEHRDEGFVVLAVSVDTEDDAVLRFLDEKHVSFRILRDPAGTVPEKLALETMPTAVLIGRDGRVRHVHEGFRAGDEVRIRELVVAALAEAAPDEAPGDRPKTMAP